MFQLVYVSAAVEEFGDGMLGDILRKSRENNARRNVTGMLFYYKQSFLQVLEGPQEDVQDLALVISQDLHHDQYRVLSAKAIKEKTFGKWTMGYVEAAQAGNMVDEYAGKDVDFPLLTLDTAQADEMLKFFRRVVGNGLPG